LVWEDRLNLVETRAWREPGCWKWWLTAQAGGDYKPLVWAGYYFDSRFWGLKPFGYHWGNVLLHALNALGVYFLLARLGSGAGDRTAPLLGALFFSLHPLRVESVSWITARKDVLFAFFYLAAVLAWLRFQVRRGRGWYGVALGAAVLSALSKAMAVTLPLVLLLLDLWRGRFAREPLRRVFSEKIPFFLAALAVGAAAVAAQAGEGALTPLDRLGWGDRLLLVPLTAGFYLWHTLFPFGLEPVYRVDTAAPAFAWAGAAAWLFFLAAAAAAARGWKKRSPAALGGAWFLLAWLPVSGVARTGLTAVADRFSYLPAVGVSLVLVTALGAPAGRRLFARALVAVAVAGCAWLTVRDQGRWRDDRRLWGPLREGTHPVPLYNLANAHAREGENAAAAAEYRKALQLCPDYYSARYNLAIVLAEEGRTAESAAEYRRALELRPDSLEARINLGNAYARLGATSAAAAEYSRVLELDPGQVEALTNRANVLAAAGRFPEALADYRRALEISPRRAQTWFNLAYTLERAGRRREARAGYLRALEIDPGLASARRNLFLLDRRPQGGKP